MMLSTADPPVRSITTSGAAIALLVALGVADLMLPRVTVSIFYAIPIVLLVQAGHGRPFWRSALVFMLLNYGLYFAKYTLWPPEFGAHYFDYRLLNRTFVAVMLAFLGFFVEMWRESEVERKESAYEGMRDSIDTEVENTFAFFLCIPLTIAVAITDFCLPYYLNVTELYALPLLACAITGNRRLLWSLTGVMVGLIFLKYAIVPQSHDVAETFVRVSRILSAAVLPCIAAFLHVWMRPAPYRQRA